MIKVLPSLLASDYRKIGVAVDNIKLWNAYGVHFDVMDGHFVPNITFGPDMCKYVCASTDLPVDVHLMVTSPMDWIKPFAEAGASYISFHAEAEPHVHRALQFIRLLGVKAGIALNPSTGLDICRYAFPYCDFVLLMSVNPGFGGQSFIPETVQKIKDLVSLREELGCSFDIEIDGGVNTVTSKMCRDAGANMLVAGSAVFNSKEPAETVRIIQG